MIQAIPPTVGSADEVHIGEGMTKIVVSPTRNSVKSKTSIEEKGGKSQVESMN